MEDRALADRLVTYADTLVAVSFVGMSGLSLALGEPDVRCSVAAVFKPVMLGNLASAFVVTALLVVLRRWEKDLRSDMPLSKKAGLYSGRLQVARFSIVWLSAVTVILAIYAASKDSSCLR